MIIISFFSKFHGSRHLTIKYYPLEWGAGHVIGTVIMTSLIFRLLPSGASHYDIIDFVFVAKDRDRVAWQQT